MKPRLHDRHPSIGRDAVLPSAQSNAAQVSHEARSHKVPIFLACSSMSTTYLDWFSSAFSLILTLLIAFFMRGKLLTLDKTNTSSRARRIVDNTSKIISKILREKGTLFETIWVHNSSLKIG